MKLSETRVQGAYQIDIERFEDERGFFARSWDPREFDQKGLDPRIAQCSISFNHKKGTLRGMHYQVPPFAETKMVRCTRGAIFDVLVDLRPDSPTFLKWDGVELNADNRRTLYIPKGCAHGFITLTDDAEVFYQISEQYSPSHASGVRWNDPLVGILWPAQPAIMHPRDEQYENRTPEYFSNMRGL